MEVKKTALSPMIRNPLGRRNSFRFQTVSFCKGKRDCSFYFVYTKQEEKILQVFKNFFSMEGRDCPSILYIQRKEGKFCRVSQFFFGKRGWGKDHFLSTLYIQKKERKFFKFLKKLSKTRPPDYFLFLRPLQCLQNGIQGGKIHEIHRVLGGL